MTRTHFNLLTHSFLNDMDSTFIRFIAIRGILMLIFSFSVLASALQAQPNEAKNSLTAQTIDLKQAIQIALANNTQMKRALLSVRDADQQIRTAWSNVMPDISASANYTRNLEVPVNFLPEIVFDPNGDPDALIPVAFGTDNNWQGGFSVSQTLFSGQAFVGISSSELYRAAQSENLRATSQGIVTQTRITYYQALVAKEQYRLIQTQIERLENNLKDTKKRHEQGFIDDYAVLQLEVQISNLEPQLTSAEFTIEHTLKDLLDIMGLPVQLSLNIKGDLSEFNIYDTETDLDENESLKTIDQLTPLLLNEDSVLAEQAMDLRGDLRILDVQKRLQGKQLDAQRSLYLPNITASYNLQWSAAQAGNPQFFGTEDTRARSQTLMVGVQVPLFQGFSRDAAVQQAKIQIKDTELQMYQAEQTANKEIYSAKQGVREAMQNNDALIKAITQAKRGYERALARYQNGVGSQQEVSDAELQLREAENNYAQMVSGYLTAKAQYDQAIGQVPFVEQDIQEIKENIELN